MNIKCPKTKPHLSYILSSSRPKTRNLILKTTLSVQTKQTYITAWTSKQELIPIPPNLVMTVEFCISIHRLKYRFIKKKKKKVAPE
jgi:hypothetical protein